MDYYLSPSGNDAWGGTLPKANADKTDGPFASIPRALQVIRANASKNPSQPARVLFREGTYTIDSIPSLYACDSGLTLEAYPGENPILSGGKPIAGWKKDGDKFWRASALDPTGIPWDFRVLSVNGSLRPRARLPEEGYYTHLTRYDTRWMSSTGGGWQTAPTQEQMTHLQYDPKDLGSWLDLANAEVAVYHMWDMSMMKPISNDPDTHTLTFAYPGEHPPGAFDVHNYVVYNVKEGMLKPGQWFLDHSRNQVVYWPLPNEDMTQAVVLAPYKDCLFRVEGAKDLPVSDLSIVGLSFTLANAPLVKGGFGCYDLGGAVDMNHTKNCRLSGLKVFQVAGTGIKAQDSNDLLVENCDVRETGACGIRATGTAVTILNNQIQTVGRIYPSAIALWTEGGSGVRILHNWIHDCLYDGITNGASDTLIEKNLIERVMLEMHDGGGIYSGFCHGVTMRGNVARDIPDTGGYGSSSYYLDEQSTQCLVEGNLSVNVARPSQNHMAHDNVIRNNIFVTEGDGALHFAKCKNYLVEKNVIQSKGQIVFRAPSDGITTFRDNLLSSGISSVRWTTLVDYNDQSNNPYEAKDGNLLADPLFQGKDDFRFQPASPALKLGIPQIGTSDAGLLTAAPAR